MTNTGLKILVIRFSSIGDIVLTTPVIRGLKLQLGGEVHYLTKNSFQNLLISNPHIDKVFSIKKNVTEVLPQLKAEQYNYIIDLHKNFRSQQIRWALKAKYLTFDKINFEKWLMVNFKRDRLPSVHIVMRYLKAVESLGVKYDGGGLDYFFEPPVPLEGERNLPSISPTDLLSNLPSNFDEQFRVNIENKLGIPIDNRLEDITTTKKETTPANKLVGKIEGTLENKSIGKIEGKFLSPFRGAGGYIAFAIGGAHATKRLPTQKIISICKKIKTPIVLLGGKADATTGEEIVLAINEGRETFNTSILNACGKLTLDESAWVVKEAKKVLTHDTGMMHIAAAFQKEIVSIWGNTIPEFGMYPFYKKEGNLNTTIQVKNLSCRPCSKIGFEKCPKGHFKCMRDIAEDEIEKVINRQELQ